MTTQEVALRLVELYNQGKPNQAQEELYHNDVASYEQDDKEPTQGKSLVMEHTKGAFEGKTKINKTQAEVIFVNHDTFLLIFDNDMEFENGYHMIGKEYGFYKVKDSKVIEEYFYAVPVQ